MLVGWIEALLVLAATIAAYQFWVSLCVFRAPQYERRQQWYQLALVWCIPVLGAVVVHTMLWADGRPPRKPELGYTDPSDNAS